MKELVVGKTTDVFGPSLSIREKTVQEGNLNFGELIKFYEQIVQKKGGYVVYDEMYKVVDLKGQIKTAEGRARDTQVDYRVKEK